jgi:predicted NAD/FAD-binding protein
MRIAVIGSGIAGMAAAYFLRRTHELTVFEAGDQPGGHTATVDVTVGGVRYPVDTGFIVYNRRNYPVFSSLLAQLGVATKPTAMTFSMTDPARGTEWAGGSLRALFADGRAFSRLLRLREILRFNREAREILARPDDDTPLVAYARARGYSAAFVAEVLAPMGQAIWSADPSEFQRFPARFFVRFFANHGFLDLTGAPTWRVVRGGSKQYVPLLTQGFRDRLRLATPIERVERAADHVRVTPRGGSVERFDQVIFAVHSDQALALLGDASPAEKEVLGALPYQPSDVVLHTDCALMPRRRAAWAAWNYHLPLTPPAGPTVTYDMNRLMGFESPVRFLVSLNRTPEIAPSSILGRYRYHHPVFTAAGIRAQKRWAEISAAERRTHFAGAYWGFGFHEDGAASGLRVARALGAAA